MRILVIGAEGAVGTAAISDLAKRHQIVTAGRSTGTHRVDLTNEASVRDLFAAVGQVDAVITTTGHTHFGPIGDMTPDQFRKGLNDKLMGQINVVLIGQHVIAQGGAFTLTSGVTNRDPIRMGANAAAVNGAIDDFVRGAAIEMPRGIRINAVSPGLLESSAVAYDGYFPGHVPVPSWRVGLAYTKAVEGGLSGKVFTVD